VGDEIGVSATPPADGVGFPDEHAANRIRINRIR
jgi:hypothetical protein